MAKRDVDVDALLGMNEGEGEETPAGRGWFGWLFASCTPRPPTSVTSANQKLLQARTHLDNRRAELMETYNEHIQKAKEHGAEHKRSCANTPLSKCTCNAARTARVHMQNASNVKKQIDQIEHQFSVMTQHQTTLQSMESVQLIRDGMSAANQALSGELKKHGDGKEIDQLADQLSESQLRVAEINQALGTSFNYSTGESVTGIEVDPSVLAELDDILQEDTPPTASVVSQVQGVSPSPGMVRSGVGRGSRRIRRQHETPSAKPVPQLDQ